MTTDETTKVLAVLKAAYPHSFKDLSKKDAEAMVDLWTTLFASETYVEVNAAVSALICTRTVGYSPTVGEIKEQLHKLRTSAELSEQEAWALVSKACCNGLYGYKKEFEKLPAEVQRAVGAPEQLREWAEIDTDTLQTVIASNFQRSYRIMQKRAKESMMLPPSIRNMLGSVADDLKMIGGGER